MVVMAKKVACKLQLAEGMKMHDVSSVLTQYL